LRFGVVSAFYEFYAINEIYEIYAINAFNEFYALYAFYALQGSAVVVVVGQFFEIGEQGRGSRVE
jgi:hypothetical protein